MSRAQRAAGNLRYNLKKKTAPACREPRPPSSLRLFLPRATLPVFSHQQALYFVLVMAKLSFNDLASAWIMYGAPPPTTYFFLLHLRDRARSVASCFSPFGSSMLFVRIHYIVEYVSVRYVRFSILMFKIVFGLYKNWCIKSVTSQIEWNLLLYLFRYFILKSAIHIHTKLQGIISEQQTVLYLKF